MNIAENYHKILIATASSGNIIFYSGQYSPIFMQ